MNTVDTVAPSHVVCFKFAIGQRVRVVDADVVGRVRQCCLSKEGQEFQVAYFDEDKRRQLDWIPADELVVAS